MKALKIFAAVSALALATSPVLAHDVEKAPAKKAAQKFDAKQLEQAAEMLSDPKTVAGISKMVEGFAGAMMQMPIGQMAATIEQAQPGTIKKDIPANATVAQLMGEDGKDLPQEFGTKSREMMGMMGGMLKAFSLMAPQLEKLGKDLAVALPKK